MPNYPQNQLYQLSSLPPGTQQPSYLQCSQFTISETEMNGKSINGCQNGTDDCPKPKIWMHRDSNARDFEVYCQ